jgi:hypothetical protein
MRKRITVALLLGLSAATGHADVVEIAPDLYLVVRQSRAENEIDLKVGAINEASKFAAGSSRVAVPISGRFVALGPLLKVYEYQFRVMSRDDALSARPILSEAVLHVAGAASCSPAVTSALMHDLHRHPALARLDPLHRIPPPPMEPPPPEESSPAESASPVPESQPSAPPTASANAAN